MEPVDWALSQLPLSCRTEDNQSSILAMLDDVCWELLLTWDRETLRDSCGSLPLKVLSFIELGLHRLNNRNQKADLSKRSLTISPPPRSGATSGAGLEAFRRLAARAIVTALGDRGCERSASWLGLAECDLCIQVFKPMTFVELLPEAFSFAQAVQPLAKVAAGDVVVFEFKASVCRIDAAVQLLQRRRTTLLEQRQLNVHLAIVLPIKSLEATSAGMHVAGPFGCGLGCDVHLVHANLQRLPVDARKSSSLVHTSAESHGRSSPPDLKAFVDCLPCRDERPEPAVRRLDFDEAAEVEQDISSRTDRAERDLAFLHMGPRYGLITRDKLCKLLCMAHGRSGTFKLDKGFALRVQHVNKQHMGL